MKVKTLRELLITSLQLWKQTLEHAECSVCQMNVQCRECEIYKIITMLEMLCAFLEKRKEEGR